MTTTTDLDMQAEIENATVAVKNEQDTMVMFIELTLISIIQGLALGVLANTATVPIIQLQFEYWSYILTGLAIILLFWSRAILHTLTFIGWPLDLVHNFIYFATTLIEVAALTQITNPINWFALTTAYSVGTFVVYFADYRLVKQRVAFFQDQVGRELFDEVQRDQLFNLRFLMPSSIAFHAIAWFCLAKFSDFFLGNHWHLLFSIIQVVVAFGLIYSELRSLERRTGLIFARRVDLLARLRAKERKEHPNEA